MNYTVLIIFVLKSKVSIDLGGRRPQNSNKKKYSKATCSTVFDILDQ